MKTEYLRTAKNSYMIVKDADFEFESYELEMVLQNDLKNLVPMQVLVADGKVEYWFDVTGMKTLEQELSVADADREMINALFFDGASTRDYAARIGITQRAVIKRRDRILRDLKKILRIFQIKGIHPQPFSGGQ